MFDVEFNEDMDDVCENILFPSFRYNFYIIIRVKYINFGNMKLILISW